MTKAAESAIDPKQAFQGSIFRDVKLDRLIESRRNPRQSWDEAAMADLVESVKRYGILTPLIVRPVGNDEKYEILAGARRFRAAREAGLDALPCRVVEVENDTALEVIVVENLQRKDIHPLEEADGFAEILDLSNGDVGGLSAKVGKKPAYVTKRLSLLKLVEKGKKLFLAGKIAEPHAMMISRLQPADQKAALEYVKDEEVSISALRDWIEQEVMRDLSKTSFSKTDTQLVPKAGSCEKCPKRTGCSKDLFDDIKQSDRCMDGACFKLKMQAHIAELEKSLQAAGYKVYGLWESYHNEAAPDGVLKQDRWLEIKKKDFCEKAAKGVFLDHQRAGQYADICADREHCKIHGSQGPHGKTPAEREKTRKDNLRQRIEKETRLRVFQKVQERQGIIDLEGLRILCTHSFERLWHGAKIGFAKAIGCPPRKSKYGGFDFNPVEKLIKGFSTPDQAAKFMVGVLCANDLDPHASSTALSYFAAEHKIDWKPVRDEVAAGLEKKAKRMLREAPKAKKKPATSKKTNSSSKSAATAGAKPPAEPQGGEE